MDSGAPGLVAPTRIADELTDAVLAEGARRRVHDGGVQGSGFFWMYVCGF